jgi:hypothetical protein
MCGGRARISLGERFRREMVFSFDAFSIIYFSKSLTIQSPLVYRVSNKFGHEIGTWDQEALVPFPPENYFSRRLNSSSHDRPEFHRHCYPGISLENLRTKLN